MTTWEILTEASLADSRRRAREHDEDLGYTNRYSNQGKKTRHNRHGGLRSNGKAIGVLTAFSLVAGGFVLREPLADGLQGALIDACKNQEICNGTIVEPSSEPIVSSAEFLQVADATKPRIKGAVSFMLVGAQYSEEKGALGFQIKMSELDPEKADLIFPKDPADPTGKKLMIDPATYNADRYYKDLAAAGKTLDPMYTKWCITDMQTFVEAGMQSPEMLDIETATGGKITPETLPKVDNWYNLAPYGTVVDDPAAINAYVYTDDPNFMITC